MTLTYLKPGPSAVQVLYVDKGERDRLREVNADMLNALESIVSAQCSARDACPHCRAQVDAARAAIANAKGDG